MSPEAEGSVKTHEDPERSFEAGAKSALQTGTDKLPSSEGFVNTEIPIP